MLNEAFNREVERLKKIRDDINSIDISDFWKGQTFWLVASRGFRDVSDFKHEIEGISKYDTEVVRLLAENKLVGIETLYIVATQMSTQCQADYYQLVRAKGVKHVETQRMFSMCTSGVELPTLFDVWSY